RLDNLQVGQMISLDIDARRINLSNLDSVLRVFDSTGHQVAVNDDSVGLDSALQYTIPAGGAGTYFVGVSSFANFNYDTGTTNSGSGGNSTGAYRLRYTVSSAPPATTDVGDIIATARLAIGAHGAD